MEEADLVPVRVARLTNLLPYLDAVQRSRWVGHLQEHDWLERASATAAMGPPDAAERQLKLARDLCGVMSSSWYGTCCVLHQIAEYVSESVSPSGELRPRPESASWWQHGYVADDRAAFHGGSHGFVHLTRGEAGRAGGALVADALARSSRVRAAMDDLKRRCWGANVVVYSTPALVARMRRAARLADAVLVPVQELRRLVEYLIEVNDHNLRGRGGRERRRRRSAPPSQRTPAREPLLGRSASMSSLTLADDDGHR